MEGRMGGGSDFFESLNAYRLSDNALRLFIWAKGPKNTHTMKHRWIIGAQAKLQNARDHIVDYLLEIRLKADPVFSLGT